MSYPKPSVTRIDPCYRCGTMHRQTDMTSLAKLLHDERRRGWVCDACRVTINLTNVIPIRRATRGL